LNTADNTIRAEPRGFEIKNRSLRPDKRERQAPGRYFMQASGIVALLVGIIASRMVNERGYQALTSDEKLRLMDGFSKTRKYSLIPLVVLIGLFYVFMSHTSINHGVLIPSVFTVLILYIIIMAVFNQRKLQSLEISPTYRRHFLLSQTLSVLGVAWFFFTSSVEQI
jgi:TRAP-type uncharacterized transport system fused permease subunit